MSTETESDRRHWRREKVSLSLNVMLLRTGMRSLGCRLIDIGHGGASIALPPASSELIKKGDTPEIKRGNEIDMLCSIETDSGRKSFHFPARVVHIEDSVIGVTFTEGHLAVDDFLEAYFSSRIPEKKDNTPPRSSSYQSHFNARHRDDDSGLPASASPTRTSRGEYDAGSSSSREAGSPFFGRLNLLVIGVLLGGFGVYFFYLQQQISDLRAAVFGLSGQVTNYSERLSKTDDDKASIQEINDRLGLMSASIADVQEQVDKLSAATAVAPVGQAVEPAGPVPPASMTNQSPVAVARVGDNRPTQPATPPAKTAEPEEQAAGDPGSTDTSETPQRGMEESGSQPRQFTVTANKVNVREEPGTQFAISFRLNQDDRVKVLTTQGIWLQVEAPDGRVGWISSTYAQPVE